MSHFYGTLKGSRGEATRCGTKNSGLDVTAASWAGAIRTRVWHDGAAGVDRYDVSLIPWHGAGASRVLAQGIVGDENPLCVAKIKGGT